MAGEVGTSQSALTLDQMLRQRQMPQQMNPDAHRALLIQMLLGNQGLIRTRGEGYRTPAGTKMFMDAPLGRFDR